MIRRPLGSVNCSNAMRPAGVCARNVAGRSSTRANNLRMGSQLHGKKRQRVGFEDRLLLLFRKRQGQELIDVLPEILHARAGPIGAPEHTVGRSEEHTSELQSRLHLVCRLLLEKKKKIQCPISYVHTVVMC